MSIIELLQLRLNGTRIKLYKTIFMGSPFLSGNTIYDVVYGVKPAKAFSSWIVKEVEEINATVNNVEYRGEFYLMTFVDCDFTIAFYADTEFELGE